jgi:uncharacterized protein (TIGR00269 family)
MRCQREAVVFRIYSGERLCSRHFKDSIREKVSRTIAQYKMLDPDDRIAVALSGGKDSVSLLRILFELEKRFPRAQMTALTIDEGIKGYREEAIAIAAENCNKLGVEHRVLSFKELYGDTLDELVSKLSSLRGEISPCSFCGVLRRRALNRAAREIGADRLATAHNLDDEVQTGLLNLIHGDIVRNARVEPVLKPEHPKFVTRVKPFCKIPESELALYAHLDRITFQTRPCTYRETSLRNEIRHMVNRLEFNHPGVKYAISSSFERLRPALKTVVSSVKIQDCSSCGEPTVGHICKPCEMLQKIGVL